MGLTQACQMLRNEFRPLYLSDMRFSTNFDDILEMLEIFGPAEVKRDFEGVMGDLKRSSLPAPGINLHELISITRAHQDKVRARSMWRGRSDKVLIAGYIVAWWLQLRPSNVATVQRITEFRLYSRPCSEQSPTNKQEYTVLKLSIPTGVHEAQNEAMAESFGRLFIHMAHLITGFQVIVELHCGSFRMEWKIDYKADMKSCELCRHHEA
jgi:hypothetical protein